MRTLAIDCATEACSIALFDGDRLIANDHRVLGRGHAERLVPMIAALPNKGKADRSLVSRGPGSFTGVRIGIATARALGFAWTSEVLGYPTLALVAAVARSSGQGPVSVSMTAGHGEWFVQNFGAQGLPAADARSASPESAITLAEHEAVAGTQAEALVERRGTGKAFMLHPDARHALAIPGSLLVPAFTPIYGRAPDAKLPQNRKDP